MGNTEENTGNIIGEDIMDKKLVNYELFQLVQSAAEQELSEQDMTGKSLIDDLHLDEAPSLLELFDNYDKLLEYLQQNAADHNVSGKENV